MQKELLEPGVDDGDTPNRAIRREGPINITRALPGRGGVVPPLKKTENKTARVVASEAWLVRSLSSISLNVSEILHSLAIFLGHAGTECV